MAEISSSKKGKEGGREWTQYEIRGKPRTHIVVQGYPKREKYWHVFYVSSMTSRTIGGSRDRKEAEKQAREYVEMM